MSLINDALKKAQKQRNEGTTPPVPAVTPDTSNEPLHRVARREKPAGFRSQLILIGGVAVVIVGLLAGGAVYFTRTPDQPAAPKPARVVANPVPAQAAPATVAVPIASSTPPPAPATATAPVPPLSLPTAAASPVPIAPVAQTPVPEPSAPAPTTSQFVIQTPAPAAVTPSPAVAAPAPTPTVNERPKASTRMIGVIEHYKVGGIRVAGAESKVLMNDKVYRINDIVDHELGIRLTAIETKALTFEDARGATHTRTF